MSAAHDSALAVSLSSHVSAQSETIPASPEGVTIHFEVPASSEPATLPPAAAFSPVPSTQQPLTNGVLDDEAVPRSRDARHVTVAEWLPAQPNIARAVTAPVAGCTADALSAHEYGSTSRLRAASASEEAIDGTTTDVAAAPASQDPSTDHSNVSVISAFLWFGTLFLCLTIGFYTTSLICTKSHPAHCAVCSLVAIQSTDALFRSYCCYVQTTCGWRRATAVRAVRVCAHWLAKA